MVLDLSLLHLILTATYWNKPPALNTQRNEAPRLFSLPLPSPSFPAASPQSLSFQAVLSQPPNTSLQICQRASPWLQAWLTSYFSINSTISSLTLHTEPQPLSSFKMLLPPPPLPASQLPHTAQHCHFQSCAFLYVSSPNWGPGVPHTLPGLRGSSPHSPPRRLTQALPTLTSPLPSLPRYHEGIPGECQERDWGAWTLLAWAQTTWKLVRKILAECLHVLQPSTCTPRFMS